MENDEDNNNNSNNNNNNSTVTRSTTPPQEERIKLTEINIIKPLKRSENVASYLNKDGAMKLYSAFCQGARGFNQLMKSIRQEYDDMYHRTWPHPQQQQRAIIISFQTTDGAKRAR